MVTSRRRTVFLAGHGQRTTLTRDRGFVSPNLQASAAGQLRRQTSSTPQAEGYSFLVFVFRAACGLDVRWAHGNRSSSARKRYPSERWALPQAPPLSRLKGQVNERSSHDRFSRPRHASAGAGLELVAQGHR